MKDRVNYYTDEHNDDFAGMSIKRETLPHGYKYVHKNIFYRFFSFVLYRLIATPVAFLFSKIRHGLKVNNRKALKACKDKGIFVYANHTLAAGDAFFPSMAVFPRRTYIVTNTDSVTISGVGKLTPMLGALPLPSERSGYKAFNDALATRIGEKGCVYIYPEAHIWPYYTGIREYPAASFLYPVKLNAPVYAATTVFRKRKFRSRPRCEVYIDGPFYPDGSLSLAENREMLRSKVYEAMKKRSELSDCQYVRYVKCEPSEISVYADEQSMAKDI